MVSNVIATIILDPLEQGIALLGAFIIVWFFSPTLGLLFTAATAAYFVHLKLYLARAQTGLGWFLIPYALTAIVARFAMYHGWYDDVIMLFPLLALYRTGRGAATERVRVAAGVLFVLVALSLVAPGGVYLLPHPWNNVYVLLQTLGVLVEALAPLGEAGDSHHAQQTPPHDEPARKESGARAHALGNLGRELLPHLFL